MGGEGGVLGPPQISDPRTAYHTISHIMHRDVVLGSWVTYVPCATMTWRGGGGMARYAMQWFV